MPKHLTHAHAAPHSGTGLWLVTLLLLALLPACGSGNRPSTAEALPSAGRYVIPMGDAEVSLILPDGYIPVCGRKLCERSGFYRRDTGWPETDSVFVLTKDARNHVIVRMLDYGKGADSSLLDTVEAFSYLNSCLRESIRADYRDVPLTPLTEEHTDPDGNPYTYVMLFSRYGGCDTLFHRPDLRTFPVGTDSVECDLSYHTLHGKRLYSVQYYSLEPFETFSFAEKRAVLESISVHDRGW